MKRFKPVVFAIVIGCTCAFILFKQVEDKTLVKVEGNAVAIQIGVFTKKENAENMSKTYGGIIASDGGIYRVYYSVLSKSDNIEFMTNYLDDNGINYYLKKITLEEDVLTKSNEFETLMQSTNDESKMAINKELLQMYEDVI